MGVLPHEFVMYHRDPIALTMVVTLWPMGAVLLGVLRDEPWKGYRCT